MTSAILTGNSERSGTFHYEGRDEKSPASPPGGGRIGRGGMTDTSERLAAEAGGGKLPAVGKVAG